MVLSELGPIEALVCWQTAVTVVLWEDVSRILVSVTWCAMVGELIQQLLHEHCGCDVVSPISKYKYNSAGVIMLHSESFHRAFSVMTPCLTSTQARRGYIEELLFYVVVAFVESASNHSISPSVIIYYYNSLI